MPRPRSFDRDIVLDRAIEIFSRQGYDATSLPDLEAGMGLGRGSLYAAFGDKLGLFRAALDRYTDHQTARAVRALDADPAGLAALDTFLAGVVDETMAFAGQRDCLVQVAAVEMAARDDGTSDRVRANYDAIEGALARAVSRAQTAGEISPSRDPALLAMFLFNTVQGIKVRARVTPDRDTLAGIGRTALTALR